MTIFQVTRLNKKWTTTETLKGKIRLFDGPHVVEHEGVRVPVVIDGDTVAIDVEHATGDLKRVLTGVAGDLPTLQELREGRVTSVSVKPTLGLVQRDAFQITGVQDENGNDYYVALERHSPSWDRSKR